MTIVMRCKKNCQHKFQDDTYGIDTRVHNITRKGRRCTVCGNHEMTASKDIEIKAKE